MHENDKKALRAAADPRTMLRSRFGRALLIASLVEDGGPGSGNYGHSGRPGQVGVLW